MAGAEILFNGRLSADALRLINPGGWYIGVRSPETRKVYAILPDPTGSGDVTVGGDAELAVANPETGKTEQFRAADLVVFQAATAMPQEPVVPEA